METTITATVGLEVILKSDKKKHIIETISTTSYWLSSCVDEGCGGSAKIGDIEGLNGEVIFHPDYIGSIQMEKDVFILVENGSDVHTKMKAVFEKRVQANKAAFALIQSFGAKSFYRQSHAFGGGIDAVVFENGKPSKEWKKGFRPKGFMPAKSDSEISKQIKALPVVSQDEMNIIYGFPGGEFIGKNIYFMPGIETVGDDYILDVSEGCTIAIKEGMKILSKSEYYALKGE